MKKLLALLLAVTMLCSIAVISVSAGNVELSDELFDAIVEFNNYKDVEKSDISLYYCDLISDDKYLVKFNHKMAGVPGAMKYIEVGNYVLFTNHPIPVIFAKGAIYEIEDAFEKGVIDNNDLYIMSSFPQLNMVRNKITKDLQNDMRRYDEDEYVTVRFLVKGSDTQITDIKNWEQDIKGSMEKLDEYFEVLHDELVNYVLKGIDHIDYAHSEGVSVVAIKKKDIERVSELDFVTEMDYISQPHLRYILTFNPQLKSYIYEEKTTEYNDDGTPQYRLIKAHGTHCADAMIGFRLGNVVLSSEGIYHNFTYKYGIYDYKDDKIYDLHELKNNYEKYNGLEELLLTYTSARRVGDSDFDSVVSVMDATKIQRVSASLEKLSSSDRYNEAKTGISGYISDFDNDSVVSVMDATAIQRYVAKVN